MQTTPFHETESTPDHFDLIGTVIPLNTLAVLLETAAPKTCSKPLPQKSVHHWLAEDRSSAC
jgi:hypothetical protein